ncbi:MAG TPA: hypothetical protein PLS49_01020 [Candidatus Woesebacteria bacterium]|nr:hypothetical protein [Candidatus Woesebacteria bacterium]
MKKKFIILTVMILGFTTYIIYKYVTEGSIYDTPKIFYIEDKNAKYNIVTDDSSGYYFLEGNNSYPDRKNFRIVIGSSPNNLEPLIGKNIVIKGEIKNKYIKNIPCRKKWEDWCRNQNSNLFLVTVEINTIETISY